MHVIYDWPIWVPLLIVLLLSLAATEVGYRAARAHRLEQPEDSVLNTIRASTLGLVALLLGFSFAVTSSRYNERSRLVLDEANSIGTCYLRAGLLAEPASTQIRDALRRYTDFRIESYQRALDPKEFDRAVRGMQGALDDVWSGVSHAVSADRQLALTSEIVPAANAVIDLSATRLWLRSYHMPASVVWLLAFSIIICAAMLGNALGEAGRRRVSLALGLNLLIVLVAFVVLDFDRPHRGLIRVDQTPLIELRATMGGS
jgi:hypothetical protein